MDVRDLKFKDDTFDLAIDKSTIDALLCGDHSFLNVAIMTKEIQRVLKVGGIYLIISYGQPENRVMHLVIKLIKKLQLRISLIKFNTYITLIIS